MSRPDITFSFIRAGIHGKAQHPPNELINLYFWLASSFIWADLYRSAKP